jgi:hypothetical protein
LLGSAKGKEIERRREKVVLLELLETKAIEKGQLKPGEEITPAKAFLLVRDMPYIRASSRDTETIIREWRGTCSGKHYLLKELFRELGYSVRLIACTTVAQIDPQEVRGRLRKLLEASNGRFVDVHNYLILELPEGEMIVDATWPLATLGMGTVVNERFVMGEDQQIASEAREIWEVPADQDPQEFKEQILRESFTEKELRHRDEFIETLGKMTNSKWVKLLLKLERLVKNKPRCWINIQRYLTPR